MTFNSYIFILLFLPMCLFGYFVLNRFRHYRLGLAFLLGMSLWFYGYFNPGYLIIICSSVIVNYIVYRLMQRIDAENKDDVRQECEVQAGNEKWKRKLVFIGGLVFNIGLLGYFKYTDFFIENVNFLFKTDFALKNILLPLGISFFTFQQVSFIADVYKDRGGISYSFLEYAAYVTYFPQLVAGPIVTHDVLVPQLQDKKRKHLDFNYLSKGITLFTFGLAKKVLLADVFGNLVNLAYNDVNALSTTTAFFAMLAYTLQIYFDFSGYSDMAIGLGWMMNIDLPVNFDSPYQALTVTEFWKRWHMTLTAFFTKYVYIPLGGNRKGTSRTYVNIFIVFLLSGFWHGAGWTFILWGIMHGLAQMLERLLKKYWSKLHPAFSWLLTFGFVNVAWIYFRAESITDAHIILSKLLSFQFGAISSDMIAVFAQPEWMLLWSELFPGVIEAYGNINMVLYFAVAIMIVLAFPNAKCVAEKCVTKRGTSFVIAFLLMWCIFSFTGVSTFLYFNF